ncbi:DUF4328 domain-containing protein [Actinocorallia sp. A-T 12471]|uniref:DUF4328 domain-containing protein n=1 Tax=Actinocorallia sp. A-T 12471 TaxID=3089813 RepID=UPI0029CDEAB6|nr:DUF4328 domain-containing protein [Actinocorallia sp. A-T 12471]MDX6742867.1 DUF4328 domain-containing protein [Actinocorallia sp. A-T 12471]
MPCGLCGDIIPLEVVRCPACGAWSRRRDFRALGIGLFMLLGFNAFLAMGSSVSLLKLSTELSRTTSLSYDPGSASVTLAGYRDVFVVSLCLAGVTGVLFLAWLWQAHGQTLSGMRGHRFWTVGAWFVPLANLWLPPRLVLEVWLASGRYPLPRRHGVSVLVMAWWSSLLAAVGLAQLFPSMRADTLADAEFAVQIGTAGAATLGLAATLAMAVVFHVTLLQLRVPPAEAR